MKQLAAIFIAFFVFSAAHATDATMSNENSTGTTTSQPVNNTGNTKPDTWNNNNTMPENNPVNMDNKNNTDTNNNPTNSNYPDKSKIDLHDVNDNNSSY